MQCGCDPGKARDSRGCTAMDVAKEHGQNHVVEFYVELSKKHGALIHNQ